MNITEEGNKMPLGMPYDIEAKAMIKSASKAKKLQKNHKPNTTYTDLETKLTWDDVFKDMLHKGDNVDEWLSQLVEKYNPPTKR